MGKTIFLVFALSVAIASVANAQQPRGLTLAEPLKIVSAGVMGPSTLIVGQKFGPRRVVLLRTNCGENLGLVIDTNVAPPTHPVIDARHAHAGRCEALLDLAVGKIPFAIDWLTIEVRP